MKFTIRILAGKNPVEAVLILRVKHKGLTQPVLAEKPDHLAGHRRGAVLTVLEADGGRLAKFRNTYPLELTVGNTQPSP